MATVTFSDLPLKTKVTSIALLGASCVCARVLSFFSRSSCAVGFLDLAETADDFVETVIRFGSQNLVTVTHI